MTQLNPQTASGTHFDMADLGDISAWDNVMFSHPALDYQFEGKVFLNDLLHLTSAEISVNKLPAKAAIPFYHKHEQNEETYLFIQGSGEYQVDGKVLAISAGSVIRVSPEGERCIRNTTDQPLIYIVVQAPANRYQHGKTVEDGVLVEKEVNWK